MTLWWLALDCVGVPADDSYLVVVPSPEVTWGPTAEPQTHPALRAHDGGWLLAYDVGQGRDQRAELQRLDASGDRLGSPEWLVDTWDGYATPELAVDAGGTVHVSVRVGQEVVAFALGETRREVVGTGDLGFWTAPDLAFGGQQRRVAWWDGDLAASAPATYWLSADKEPLMFGTSEGSGSPVALARWREDELLVAWSVRTEPQVGRLLVAQVGADGVPGEPVRVDDVDLDGAPTRPAVVGWPAGFAVAWRAQDAAQTGLGARLRWFDAHGRAAGPSVALGLLADGVNRVELDVSEDLVAAVWEEPSADGDVALQLFDLHTGVRRTGVMRVHDQVDGRQARPRVAFDADGDEVAVAYETGGPPQVALRRFGLEWRDLGRR